MSGVGLSIDIADLLRAEMHVSRLALESGDAAKLLEELGALGESQTRRRIESEKTAPDGTAWKPNIEGHSILLESGRHLRDSVAFVAHGAEEVEWGRVLGIRPCPSIWRDHRPENGPAAGLHP